MIEHIIWAVTIVALIFFGFAALAGIAAVFIDRHKRKHQQTYIGKAPRIEDCERRYTP